MQSQSEPMNITDSHSNSSSNLRYPSSPHTPASGTDSSDGGHVYLTGKAAIGVVRPQCMREYDSSQDGAQGSSQEEGGQDSSQEEGGITRSGGNGSGDNGSGGNAPTRTKASSTNTGTASTDRSSLNLVTPFCPLEKVKGTEQVGPKHTQSPSHRVVLRPLPPGFAAQHIQGHGVNGAWPDPSNSFSDAATKNQFMQNWAESVDRSLTHQEANSND